MDDVPRSQGLSSRVLACCRVPPPTLSDQALSSPEPPGPPPQQRRTRVPAGADDKRLVYLYQHTANLVENKLLRPDEGKYLLRHYAWLIIVLRHNGCHQAEFVSVGPNPYGKNADHMHNRWMRSDMHGEVLADFDTEEVTGVTFSFMGDQAPLANRPYSTLHLKHIPGRPRTEFIAIKESRTFTPGNVQRPIASAKPHANMYRLQWKETQPGFFDWVSRVPVQTTNAHVFVSI